MNLVWAKYLKKIVLRNIIMDPDTSLIVFQGKGIRRIWHNKEWHFSVVDVITILTNSSVPRRYWSDLKIKLKDEGFELYEKIVQLKLKIF